MNSTAQHKDRFGSITIDLKSPGIAALLAWLWPGAGHLYQRRKAKGLLYMVCILITYFWGLAMGDGHVVYASWQKPDFRYQYFFQLGVGIPAFPALLQKAAAENGNRIFDSHIMAPPRGQIFEEEHDELAIWHEELGFYFELGTLYTMIAGLLNMLVIYDAYAGPVFADPKGPPDKKSKQASDADEPDPPSDKERPDS